MPITTRHWRRLEAPSGVGTIYDGSGYVATVRYGLRVLQEIVGTRHWSGAGAIKGDLRVRGRLHVTAGSLPFDGDHLTLRLADGRALAFYAVGAGPSYTIDPSGSLG
jgi:hypothetical protein